MHQDLATGLEFPGYYGSNLDALNDCFSNLEIPEASGRVLIFNNFHKFAARFPITAWKLLDIVEWNSSESLLFGRRLFALVQSDDARLSFEPVGCRPVMWNQRSLEAKRPWTIKSLWKLIGEKVRLAGKYVQAIAGAGFSYFIAFIGVKLALPAQPVIALIVSVITLVMAIVFAVLLSNFVKKFVPTTVAIVAMFVASIYAAAGAFTGFSATIYTWRPSSYSVTAGPSLIPTTGQSSAVTPTDDPFETFSHYYTVQMLDLIPGIEFSKTLALPTSVEPKSKLGGLPVLGFKIYMILAIIGALKKWKELRKERATGKVRRL